MSPFATTLRRFSRSSTRTKESQSPTVSHSHPASIGAASNRSSAGEHPYISNPIPQQPATGTGGLSSMHPDSTGHNTRPLSSGTDGSFDFANRPVSHQQQHQQQNQHQSRPSQTSQTSAMMPVSPTGAYASAQPHAISGNGLSRTDQIVLKHFWDTKYQENTKRDLHYLQFPFFSQYPTHADLLPYCEIYHLIKTSPGANIISLGSTSGVYIGFELSAGSQLHIDMDDEWHNISHHRVHFRPYESLLRDPDAEGYFKHWPKPLTIEFLEEEYQKWILDLMSLCWEGREVRELGGPNMMPAPSTGASSAGTNPAMMNAASADASHNPSASGVPGTGMTALPASSGLANGGSVKTSGSQKRF